jgi:glyoxylase-like metal-dependent hydrolase (beta-lactamase superfamily II)
MVHFRLPLFVGAFAVLAAGQSQETKTVSVQTLSVFDILYVLKGGGSNSLALMRDDGVVLIDSKPPGWGKPIIDAVNGVSDKPVVTIINTNAQDYHTGGNTEIPTVTQIIGQEKTKANMQKIGLFQGPNAKFLPTKLVTDKMSLLDGMDRIDLYYFGAASTSGDLVVVFPEKHVAYFGDMFPSKAVPFIDAAKGGSGVAFPETLAKAAAEIKGVTRVVTGHEQGSVTSSRQRPGAAISANPATLRWADFVEYGEFNRDFVAAVRASMQAGKTADQEHLNCEHPTYVCC